MEMTFVALITASRDWERPEHRKIMTAVLLNARKLAGSKDFVVRHGAARGGDQMAEEIAQQQHWRTDPHPVHPTTWRTLGKRAGFVRNEHMVNLGADICLAFILHCTQRGCRRPQPHGSHGASGCARLALRAGIPLQPWWVCPRDCACLKDWEDLDDHETFLGR